MQIYPTQERLLELFEYDPEVGSFKRLKTTGRKAIKNSVIFGSVKPKGYLRIGIDGSQYFSHKLAWIISNGNIPIDLQIDHINGCRSDNRLCNLRLVTPMENSHNQRVGSNNTSGYIGVCWHVGDKKWRACIGVDHKVIYLGNFNSPEEAGEAYLEAKKIYHPSAPTN